MAAPLSDPMSVTRATLPSRRKSALLARAASSDALGVGALQVVLAADIEDFVLFRVPQHVFGVEPLLDVGDALEHHHAHRRENEVVVAEMLGTAVHPGVALRLV